MKLRRGFKKEASELAEEVRGELRLGPFDCLDPRRLAQHLEIPIIPLSEYSDICKDAQYLFSIEPDAFSAVTVFDNHQRLIMHNDSHSVPRQNSNLAHELSHGLLLHEPAAALDKKTGCRIWDPTNEEEADWLAGELLVTNKMALAVARGRFTPQHAMTKLCVSRQMLEWRLNMTGAFKRVQFEKAKRRKRRKIVSR
ncbi:MAG: ImmA/IrrE family metallo-endopeptidase [Acidimicrobiaceae bacterium]|nr:ImmA/IrrE family metallo-endopeptidase [Acidimicrobiaceae bacterium]